MGKRKNEFGGGAGIGRRRQTLQIESTRLLPDWPSSGFQHFSPKFKQSESVRIANACVPAHWHSTDLGVFQWVVIKLTQGSVFLYQAGGASAMGG